MTPKETAALLREAAAAMTADHGPDHERYEMWNQMAMLLYMQADHAAGQGSSCGSCVREAERVAEAYMEART